MLAPDYRTRLDGLTPTETLAIFVGTAGHVLADLGLAAKGPHWYLVAARDGGEIRTYRVSRIQHAALTADRFPRPDRFDLAAHWESARERYFAGLRDYPVRLRVRDRVRHRLQWAPNAEIEQVQDLAGGWSEVTARFEKAYETRVFLLGLAGDVVVLEPAELRDAMTSAARALVAHHEG